MLTAAGRSVEYRGLSTDDKPVEYVENGAVFLEMDTSKVFIFDAENKNWIQLYP